MRHDPIACGALGACDSPRPAGSDMPVGEVRQVDHVASAVLALDDHAGALWVDRDDLGDMSVEPIGAVVVAVNCTASLERNSCVTSVTSAPQRAACQTMAWGGARLRRFLRHEAHSAGRRVDNIHAVSDAGRRAPPAPAKSYDVAGLIASCELGLRLRKTAWLQDACDQLLPAQPAVGEQHGTDGVGQLSPARKARVEH